MARVIDVSLPIGPKLLAWPGDPPVSVDPSSRIAQGGSANVSDLHFGSHTGTHVDPPFHFIDGGKTIDEIAPEVFIGQALVVDLTGLAMIGASELEALALPDDVERVLFKTSNSELWRNPPIEFPDEYTHLTPEGARWIADRGLRLVGTDFLSIEERGAPGHPTHVILLEEDIVIVEGLDLRNVEPGNYIFICLPLRIEGGDGAPARAVLIQ